MVKSVFIAIAGAAALCVALPASAEVRMERVRFTSNGDEIQGDLYIPDSVTSKKPGPAVVVTGAWMTVKEQMPARYAREMAQRGFVALAFDFRGWGQSGGERRQYEDPSAKIADIRAAVEYLKTRPEIAADAIGGLGVCASSGYMVTAAASTPLIRSVALVAPWLHDREILEETYGGREGVEKLTAAGGAAEAANKKSGRQSFVPAASLTDKTAIMFGVPYYTERDRGLIPAWRNEADPGFWPGWLGFDAVKAAPAVTQPFLMVHSEAAAIPKGAHRFYARLTSPKSELWLDNVSQFDFYDQPVPVTRASDAAAAHFRKTLLNDTEKQRRDGLASAGVREFFAALEALDIPQFLRVWADDGVQDMPFAPGTFPKRLEGKAAIERQYGPLPSAFSGTRFPVRRLVTTNEPGLVIAEYDGSIGLKSGGRYDNRYVGTFQFNAEGKLAHFTEYFDPLTLIRGFPGAAEAATPDDERIRRAVESLGAATDSRDWTAVRAIFADDVDLDYTSVAGGAPARVKADALVAGWTQGLGRYQSTRHNFSGARVTIQGDQATAAFSGQATHVKTNGERWSCGGDYTYRFVRTPQGWKANAATFAMQWEQGIR